MNKFFPMLMAAILGSFLTIIGYRYFSEKNLTKQNFSKQTDNQNSSIISYSSGSAVSIPGFNLAAKNSVSNVVHITASARVRTNSNYDLPDFFRDFFGGNDQQQEHLQKGSGSGVIISSDGYIVTNNHVIQNAEEVEVALHDKRVFKAKVVGADPLTDIAIIKIEASDLSYIIFGKSDSVEVGDWVLAVGNPFNLSSTVTAGIVSAKGRNINILRDKFAVESFIQTDAAVNPGNSGGALVNLRGELIGINTAIATPTGTYAGYAFAVPSDLVAKVVKDLKEFGIVQRAFLGIQIREMDGELAKELGVDITEGVYVDKTLKGSSAEESGVKAGDIIQKIDGEDVKSTPELLEKIAGHRPGDKVKVSVLRKDKKIEISVILKNQAGNVDIVKKENNAVLETLGADFENVTDKKLMKQLNIEAGVQIKNIREGKLSNQTAIKEGFIITRINNRPMRSVNDLINLLDGYKGGVMVEGVYPNSDGRFYYAFGM